MKFQAIDIEQRAVVSARGKENMATAAAQVANLLAIIVHKPQLIDT